MSEGEPISLNGSEIDPKLESVMARLEERTNGHKENPKLDLPSRRQGLEVDAAEYKPYAEVETQIYDELRLEEARRDIWQAAAERAASIKDKGPLHYYDAGFAKAVEGLSPIDEEKALRNFRNAQKSFLTKWIDGAKEFITGIPANSPLKAVATLLQENHGDGATFHSMVAPLILPMAAGQVEQMLSESSANPEAMMRFYAALKTGTEGNGGGWILDPFNMKGKKHESVREVFPQPEAGPLTVRPLDYPEETLGNRIIFLPYAAGGMLHNFSATEPHTDTVIQSS